MHEVAAAEPRGEERAARAASSPARALPARRSGRARRTRAPTSPAAAVAARPPNGRPAFCSVEQLRLARHRQLRQRRARRRPRADRRRRGCARTPAHAPSACAICPGSAAEQRRARAPRGRASRARRSGRSCGSPEWMAGAARQRAATVVSGQPALAAAVVLDVAEALAPGRRQAEVELLHVLVLRELRRRRRPSRRGRSRGCSRSRRSAAPPSCSARRAGSDTRSFAFRSRTISKISSTSCGARPIDGSSSRIIFGRAISARPIAVICCSPPEV